MGQKNTTIECSLRARVAEHHSSINSEVSHHVSKDFQSHQVKVKEVRILSRENHWLERGIKEAIHISSHQPTLNRDGGRYQLPHIWVGVLTPKTEDVAESSRWAKFYVWYKVCKTKWIVFCWYWACQSPKSPLLFRYSTSMCQSTWAENFLWLHPCLFNHKVWT